MEFMTLGRWDVLLQVKTSNGYFTITDIPVLRQHTDSYGFETLINFNGHELFALNDYSSVKRYATYDKQRVAYGFTFREKVK